MLETVAVSGPMLDAWYLMLDIQECSNNRDFDRVVFLDITIYRLIPIITQHLSHSDVDSITKIGNYFCLISWPYQNP